MEDQLLPCPSCSSPYGYYMSEQQYACPECSLEWNPNLQAENLESEEILVKDSNGNQLFDGDAVITIKTLPVKGAAKPIKAGTKVKNIRLQDGDHNIGCKIPGFGAMALKSEFVKKA